MTRLRTALAIGIVLALSLVTVACGSEEENDYVDEVNALQTDFFSQFQDLTAETPSSAGDVAATTTELADLTSQLATDIEAVEPPEQVADLHQQFVDELNKLADELAGLEEQVRGADPQEALQAATELITAITDSQNELQSLITQINNELNE